MRKITLTLFMVTVSYMIVNAQSRISELGLSYSGSNLMGIRYKFGNENSLLRLTILIIGGGNDKHKGDNSEIKSSDQGVALNVGFEKSNSVKDDLSFYYGAELLSDLETRTYKNVIPVLWGTTDRTRTISTGLGFVLGFAYYFSSNVNLSAEITPSIWYSATKSTHTSGASKDENTSKIIVYGFNREGNSFANLTLSFRIKPRQVEDPRQIKK